MDDVELASLVQKIERGSPREQEQAAWILAQSEDAHAVSLILDTFDHQRLAAVAGQTALEALIDAGARSVPHLVRRVERDPSAESGRLAGYALGEIAYKDSGALNDSIVPPLQRAVKQLLAAGSRAVAPFVMALRECVRAGPIRALDESMHQVLRESQREKDPDLLALDGALEILHTNGGQQFEDEARGMLAALPDDSGLAEALRHFLANVSAAPSRERE